MTVSKQQNKIQYTGDGVTTLFPYPYPFIEQSDIVVFIDDVKQVSGFTVEKRDSYENGSNITITNPPASGSNIIITRDIPTVQDTSYPENDAFPSAVTEQNFDKLTLQIIDLKQSTIKVPLETPPGFNPVMPKPVPNKGIKYDATGEQLITTEFDPDEALETTKQYRDEAQAAALAAQTSEANSKASETNAKQSETIATQKAQEVTQTADKALQDINTEGTQSVALAKDWAIKMDDKVDGVDFSAKYWAKLASAAVQQRVLNEMIISPVPLISAALHLTDGEKLVYGSNAQYIDYMIEYKKTYPEYFTTEEEWQRQVAANGRCAKYVLDEGAKTIRLPKIIGYIEGTVTPSELGVFSYQFDTSRSSSIYRNDVKTVQTDSIKVYYYIVVATGVKTDVQVDIDKLVTDLNNKADRDLSNCTRPYVVETYYNEPPQDPDNIQHSWYRVWSDGWCEQGGYTLTGSGGTKTITLLKPFKSFRYSVSVVGAQAPDATPSQSNWNAKPQGPFKSTQFNVIASISSLVGVFWKASGYIK